MLSIMDSSNGNTRAPQHIRNECQQIEIFDSKNKKHHATHFDVVNNTNSKGCTPVCNVFNPYVKKKKQVMPTEKKVPPPPHNPYVRKSNTQSSSTVLETREDRTQISTVFKGGSSTRFTKVFHKDGDAIYNPSQDRITRPPSLQATREMLQDQSLGHESDRMKSFEGNRLKTTIFSPGKVIQSSVSCSSSRTVAEITIKKQSELKNSRTSTPMINPYLKSKKSKEAPPKDEYNNHTIQEAPLSQPQNRQQHQQNNKFENDSCRNLIHCNERQEFGTQSHHRFYQNCPDPSKPISQQLETTKTCKTVNPYSRNRSSRTNYKKKETQIQSQEESTAIYAHNERNSYRHPNTTILSKSYNKTECAVHIHDSTPPIKESKYDDENIDWNAIGTSIPSSPFHDPVVLLSSSDTSNNATLKTGMDGSPRGESLATQKLRDTYNARENIYRINSAKADGFMNKISSRIESTKHSNRNSGTNNDNSTVWNNGKQSNNLILESSHEDSIEKKPCHMNNSYSGKLHICSKAKYNTPLSLESSRNQYTVDECFESITPRHPLLASSVGNPDLKNYNHDGISSIVVNNLHENSPVDSHNGASFFGSSAKAASDVDWNAIQLDPLPSNERPCDTEVIAVSVTDGEHNTKNKPFLEKKSCSNSTNTKCDSEDKLRTKKSGMPDSSSNVEKGSQISAHNVLQSIGEELKCGVASEPENYDIYSVKNGKESRINTEIRVDSSIEDEKNTSDTSKISLTENCHIEGTSNWPDPCLGTLKRKLMGGRSRRTADEDRKKSKIGDTSCNQNLNVENTVTPKATESMTNDSEVQPVGSVCSQLQNNLPPLPPDIAYENERVQIVDDEYKKALIKNAELASTLKNGWKILPHQKAGIIRGLLMRRLILAFDMGLGKTLIGCVWAKAFKQTFKNLKIYIICPVSLKNEWNRTASEATGLKCEEEKKKKSEKINTSLSLDLQICSWAKVPTEVPGNIENYIVIGDEAHSMQSMESSRTKEMLKLVLSNRCIGVLLLTGTPMKNGKPSNLFPLLRAVRHPFGDKQKLFEIYFCNGQQKRFGGSRVVWDANGSSNLSLLNAHISQHVFHKTKEDCLKELPPKSREYRTVPVSSRYELQHANAMNELADAQKLADTVLDNDLGQEKILGALTKVRQVASFAKIDATVALAKSILEKESSIVIFTFFVLVAKDVHRKLNELGWCGELLVGETPAKKRQAMVDNFQSGVSPVFVCTFGAGGVGITLTEACTVILLDRPWTPGDALQAEDRVRRIGQTRPVRSIWMRAFKVDEQIDALIEEKNNTSCTVVDGRPSLEIEINKNRSAPKISMRRLVQSIVAKNCDSM